ncbi:AVO1 [Candida margitis]|uniref:AVO1 n=1 Tax=Candida margitis TaxID=1775924 RepID=UPI002227E417|nr:AVO1 [Candida margitis]KAI5967547.1 AVO1 [Candida margitis]
MAFPLDQAQLLNHLRTSYLSLGDESEYFKRIIAPSNPGDEIVSERGVSNCPLQNSPPITFEIGSHVKRTIDSSPFRERKGRSQAGESSRRRRSKAKRDSQDSMKNVAQLSESDSLGLSLDDEPINNNTTNSALSERYQESTENGLNDIQEDETKLSSQHHFGALHSKHNKRKGKTKSKSKIPIVKFFKSGKDEISDSDSSDDERRGSVITYKSSSLNTSKEDLTDKESTSVGRQSLEQQQLADHRGSPSVQVQDNASSFGFNDKFSEVTTDDEGDGDHPFESDEEISDDSEFTDLDNDTILDSFSRSDSITNALDKSIQNKNSVVRQFSLNRKKRANTFGDHTVPKNLGANYLNSQTAGSNLSQVRSFGNLVELERPSLSFPKVEPKVTDTNQASNLSSMIHTKFKSTTVNPLNYYLFVDGSVSANSQRAAQLNVFLPPKRSPVLTNLNIDRSVSVADCIGYILLNLLKLQEVSELNDPSFLNPNFWRLELVDEDGENYGSFGILDRNRTFASYNNPKDLALCRVKDVVEIDRNETLSPLPIEFKQNLSAFEQKKKSIDQSEDDIPKVDLLVSVFEYDNSGIPQKVPFKAPRSYTMGQVLKEFCVQRGLITTEYRFKVVEAGGTRSRYVKDVELCRNLHSSILELVPSDSKFNLILDREEKNSQIVPATTPEMLPANLTAPNITPYNDELSAKVHDIKLESSAVPAAATASLRKPEQTKRKQLSKSTKSMKETMETNKYLDDIIQGNNPQLPTNINSIYFKWKVLKNNSKMKKMKIKTFTEKNFIIDGDYIHITPPDDLMLKNIGESVSHNQPLNFNQHHTYHNLNQQLNRVSNKQSTKTYSFHITQIMKVKQYSKHPDHFRIIVKRQQADEENGSNSKDPMKKFYLVSKSEAECSEIISKLKWVLQAYKLSSGVL